MGLFKNRNTLKKRVIALEGMLGLVYAKDEYGDFEHFEKKWGFIPETNKKLDEKKGKK